MNKLALVLAALVCFGLGWELRPLNAPATITLTTPYSQTGQYAPTETDIYSTPMAISADQTTGIILLTLYPAKSSGLTTGAGKTTGYVPGSLAPTIVTLNTITGQWQTNIPNSPSGVLTGANLTGAQGWLSAALTPAMKDAAESWLASAGVIPGTQTYPW